MFFLITPGLSGWKNPHHPAVLAGEILGFLYRFYGFLQKSAGRKFWTDDFIGPRN